MHTTTLALSQALNPRRLAILVGAGMLAVTAMTAGRAYMDIQDSASDRLVEMSAAFKAAPDLATLKADSDLVIVGRVARPGTTQLIHQTGNNPGIKAPAPAAMNLDSKKTDAERLQPPAPGTPSTNTIGNANMGTPQTTYTLQVERYVKGNAQAQISLTQLSGHDTLDTYPGG